MHGYQKIIIFLIQDTIKMVIIAKIKKFVNEIIIIMNKILVMNEVNYR